MARLTDIDALLEKVTKLVADGGNTAEMVGKIIIAITDAPIMKVDITQADERKIYITFPDGLRLVIEDGEYVGWYYCGEVKADGERKDNE